MNRRKPVALPGCVEIEAEVATSMPKRDGEAQGRITGKIIIEQLLRNLELGQFEMGYSVLVPCIFSLYLHPDDYARLTGVFDLIREDARRALTSGWSSGTPSRYRWPAARLAAAQTL